MKAIMLFSALLLTGVSAGAMAGQPDKLMPGVTVAPVGSFAGCTPATNSNSPECRNLRVAVLANFAPGELGLIFGATTTHLAFIQTGAQERLRARYGRFLQQYESQYLAGKSRVSAVVQTK